jgi:DNA adenine methylase
MILKRLGNKTKIANKIINNFPEHTTYFEPFFGAGGIFFNKPKAKYNYLNDLDNDVYNLYKVILNNRDKLIEQIELMPIHNTLFKYWIKNKETEPLKKAIRFSNCFFYEYLNKLYFNRPTKRVVC